MLNMRHRQTSMLLGTAADTEFLPSMQILDPMSGTPANMCVAMRRASLVTPNVTGVENKVRAPCTHWWPCAKYRLRGFHEQGKSWPVCDLHRASLVHYKKRLIDGEHCAGHDQLCPVVPLRSGAALDVRR